ncbi:MAG: outer membrane protein TolC [Planctomycetota bacterium]|jgi:outer membrane protein TolC
MKLSYVRQTFLSVVLLITACASPPAEPIEDEHVAKSIESRSDGPEVLESALGMISAKELAFLPSHWQEHVNDPGHLSYWQACALAWTPEVRQARRNLEAAIGRERAAGYPGPLTASERVGDFGDPDLSNEVVATFDLLGVLGLGPVAAAEELADARTRAAYGALEVAAWRAIFSVSRAATRLVAVRAERSALEAHFGEAKQGADRARFLLERGRLGSAPVSRIKSFLGQLGARVAALKAEEAQRWADLSVASGLSMGTTKKAIFSLNVLQDSLRVEKSKFLMTNSVALLGFHPQLRQLHLEYAIAEARIRSEAAEAWPKINIGPRFDIKPDDFLTGGVVRLSLPWPGSIDGRVEAAVAERSAARQRLEDELVKVSARLTASIERRSTLQKSAQQYATPALESSQVTWRGMRARFQVDESIWDLWTDALQLRRNAISTYYQNQRDLLLAKIDQMMDQTSMEATHE